LNSGLHQDKHKIQKLHVTTLFQQAHGTW